MDSRKLSLLMAAIRTGSLRKAAKECGVTQSAVTQSMDALESELGFAVIKRSHRGVTLTAAGELVLPQLTKAYESFVELDQLCKDVAADVAAPIRLGVIGSVAGTWLSAAIEVYKTHVPDARFEILVGTDALNDWMNEGKIDLALCPELTIDNYRWHPLMDEPCRLVVPETTKVLKKKLNAKELKDVPLIMAPKGVLDDQSLGTMDVLCCDDDMALISLAAQNIGVAIVPQSALRNAPAGIQVLDFDPPAVRTLGVALPNTPREGAQSFADYLMRNMPYKEHRDETPEEAAMRASIRRALAGETDRSWKSPIFK